MAQTDFSQVLNDPALRMIQQGANQPSQDVLNTQIDNELKTSPHLLKDPYQVQALIQQGYNLKMVNKAYQYSQSEHLVNKGFWGSLWDDLRGVGKATLGVGLDLTPGIGQALSLGPDYSKSNIPVLSQASQYQQHLKDATKGIGGMVSNIGRNIYNDPSRLLGGGLLTSGGRRAALSEMQLPLTMASAFASGVNKNGLAATLGDFTPTFVLSLLTDNALSGATGETLDAATLASRRVAADQALLDGADTNLLSGRLTDPQYLSDLADAAQRVKAATNVSEPIAPDAFTSSFSKSAQLMNQLTEAAGKLGGTAFRGLSAANKAIYSPGANFAYSLTAPLIQAKDPKAWEAALQGKVIAADGKFTTVGDELAGALGQNQGFFHDVMANVINFDLSMMDDPYASVGRLWKESRSFYGFTGRLSEMFPGIGIRGAGDATRAYRSYGSVRRAVDWIAEHNGAEIADRFRNTFGPKLLKSLEKASTPEEVLSVFEDVSFGQELVHGTMPTMGWYTAFKASLRGDIGRAVGTVGRATAHDLELAEGQFREIEEQTGYDIRPKNFLYTSLNPAGKSDVLLRQRFANQFIRLPMWFSEHLGSLTTREFRTGSVNVIPALMDLMRSVHIPEDTVLAFGDTLLHAVGDSAAYRRAYREIMFEVIRRPIGAMLPAAEFEAVSKALDDMIWDEANRITGADGAGLTGTYTASKDAWRDTIATDRGPRQSGLGLTHRGTLILPTARELRTLHRNFANIVQNLQSHEQLNLLMKTNASLEELRAVADVAKTELDDLTKTIRDVVKTRVRLGAETFERPAIHDGFVAKGRELSQRYNNWIQNDSFRGLTRAERVALVAKDVQDELTKLIHLHGEALEGVKARLDQGLDMSKIAEATGQSGTALQDQLDRLWGEKRAVEEINANINAQINKMFGSTESLDTLAKTVAALTEKEGEARQGYVKAFKERWAKASDSLPTLNNVFRFGKRDLRNNRELWMDLAQAYVNKVFKPLALSTPAWATRVSMSEIMLNSLRTGGMEFFESHLASSIAKHTWKLAQYDAAEFTEKGVFKKSLSLAGNIIGGAMLGLERGLLEGLTNGQKERLVSDALTLLFDEGGIAPMGVHSHSDSVTSENMTNGSLSQVYGINDKGEVESGHMYRGENYTKIQANDAGAATALAENLSRAANDEILRPAFEFLHNLAQQTGTAAMALDEERLMKRVYDEAVRRVTAGAGKDAFARRNDFVNALRAEVQNSTEFKAINEAEKRVVLEQIDAKAKTIENITADDMPRYLRGAYNAANKRIASIERAIPLTETKIAEAERQLSEAERLLTTSEAGERVEAMTAPLRDSLDDVERRLRTVGSARALLDDQIANHPFRQFYDVMEKGAALKPYKEILNELRGAVADKVTELQDEAERRIREIIGNDPVVLPRDGFAEMDDRRIAGGAVFSSTLYDTIFERHPELWANNEYFDKFFPLGMPGVQGREPLWMLESPDKFAEAVQLAHYHGQLQEASDLMASGNFEKAYGNLANLDPTTVSWLRPTSEAAAEPSKAIEAFNVRGVPADLIMGVGRTSNRTLSDLALHLRGEQALEHPALFNKRFHPYYAPDAAGQHDFLLDFEENQKVLKSKTASEQDKAKAAHWFSTFVSPEPNEWATTGRKVWKDALDSNRSRIAREKDRADYYSLLERRKELSAERSRIGLEKKRLLDRAIMLPTADDVMTQLETDYSALNDKLTALYEQRAGMDERLTEAHTKRDDLETHVVRQDEIYRTRQAEKVVEQYKTRIRMNTKGIGGLIRRIEARTATINGSLEKAVRQVVDEQVSALASKSLTTTHDELRQQLSDFMYAHLSQFDPKELAEMERANFPRQYFSSGDPLRDYADDIAEHALTLTTGAKGNTFFPELARMGATGNVNSPQSLAKWLSERVKNNQDYPTNFPAREFVSPFAKGSKQNLIMSFSDRLHNNVLGPIVNELSREPTFIWEYHQQMERLRGQVASGWISEDQAKVMAKATATINMSKFVHNPMDKTVWENNMRVLAPFYFAKNQAMRRALRLAGDDPTAFYKYLRLNMMITDYVAHNSNGQGNFNIPGSAVVGALSSGMTGAALSLFGKNSVPGASAMGGMFGFDGSPNSVESMVITGNSTGPENIFQNLIGVPFGPVVDIPAKLAYQYLFHFNPVIGHVANTMLGNAAMNSSWVRDVIPNSFVYGGAQTIQGVGGFVVGSKVASVFGSTENHVQAEMANQLFATFYREAQKKYPQLNSRMVAQFGSKEALWSFYAQQEFSTYMHKPGNFQNFLDHAALSTTIMYVAKMVLSSSLPTAVSLADTFNKNANFSAIGKERGSDGKLKYPTYIEQLDEYLRRYPTRPFDLVAATTSTGVSMPETTAASQTISNHYSAFEQYPNAAAFLISQANTQYDPTALTIEYGLNLRQREAPYDFLKSINVAMGEQVYQTVINAVKRQEGALKADGSLSYKAYTYVDNYMKSYGQALNNDYLQYKYGGKKQSVANEAYSEMQAMLKDSQFTNLFSKQQREFYQNAFQLRDDYVAAYRNAQESGASLSTLRNEWYNACQKIASEPQYTQYANWITGVLQNLPDPQG